MAEGTIATNVMVGLL